MGINNTHRSFASDTGKRLEILSAENKRPHGRCLQSTVPSLLSFVFSLASQILFVFISFLAFTRYQQIPQTRKHQYRCERNQQTTGPRHRGSGGGCTDPKTTRKTTQDSLFLKWSTDPIKRTNSGGNSSSICAKLALTGEMLPDTAPI